MNSALNSRAAVRRFFTSGSARWGRRVVPWAAVVLAALGLPAAASDPVGWRYDGTGSFPAAEPPLAWGAEHNVAWKAPLPGWSNASPVPVGDYLFFCQEPDLVLCVSMVDGSVVWSQSVGPLDLLPEAERTPALERQAVGERLAAEIRNVQRQRSRLHRQLREDADNEALQQQVRERDAELEALRAQIEPYLDLIPPATHSVSGFSSPTPTSDGQRVYVLFGTGIAAAFDLDGNRLWARRIERPTHEWGHSASPLLAGGRLVVHIENLTGLDPETGETVWTVTSKRRFGAPVALRTGGEDVVVTAHGEAVRAADGLVLARDLGSLEYGAPLVRADVVYFIVNQGRAVRLTGGEGGVETLWTTEPHRDRYYASPVYAQGLLFAITRRQLLSAIDAATGEVVYAEDLRLGGTAYPSIAYAGGYLFISSDNGKTMVVEPGREFKPVGTNQLDPFRSTPLFLGDRIYIRALEHLYCITEVPGVGA